MSDQFLNLEGRDTFNADNGYEKVKIVNGGIPQNSDLNEQSSIDEERARNIMKEGFGSGKRHKDDFTIHLDTGELLLKVRESEAGVIGTLWQDGNRLKLLSASDITIADNDTTPVYRKLKSTGYFRGRVYLVHAKQDYIDPNAKLTVRDINSTNLIQVDTAVREKRVVDYYIDWSEDGVTEIPTPPARIDSNNPVTLDDDNIFSGKVSFSNSPLYGFSGYLYYLGDIIQVDGGMQDINQELSERFVGNADNVLYTGGDDAHRRDTEVSGLINTGDTDTDALNGLKVEIGGTSTTPEDIVVDAVTYHVRLVRLQINQTETNEQLHIPSKGYFTLDSNLTSVELFNVGGILEKNGLTLETFFQTAFTDVGISEGAVSDNPLILYVDGTGSVVLSNLASYKIWYETFASDPNTFEQTKDRFVIALFYVVIQSYNGTTKDVTLSFFVEDPAYINYMYDKRRYRVNSVDKIQAPIIDRIVNLKRHAVIVDSPSGTFVEGLSLFFGSDSTIPLFIGIVRGWDSVNSRLFFESFDSVYFSSGMKITQSDGVTALYSYTSISADDEPDIVDIEPSNQETGIVHKTENDLTISNSPKTLSYILGKIKGALAALQPEGSTYRVPSYLSAWANLFKSGIAIPYLSMKGKYYPARILWDLPILKMPNILHSLFSILWGEGNSSKREGKVIFVNLSRTLRDSDGNVMPVVYIKGHSIEGSNFAPMIHLVHTQNTGSTETPENAAGQWGGMIVLEGKNGIIACPRGADFRDVYDGNTGVIIDGESGTIQATIGSIGILSCVAVTTETLTCSGKATLNGTTNQVRGTDTQITGAQLNTLVGHGNADSLHNHGGDFVPIGTILASILSVVPSGYLYCDGSEQLITSYPDLSDSLGTMFGTASPGSFKLPNLKGMFLRGQDDSEGVDLDAGTRTAQSAGGNDGDQIGSYQADAFKKTTSADDTPDHKHNVTAYDIRQYSDRDSGGSGNSVSHPASTITSTGASPRHTHVVNGRSDNETHPKNIYVRYYIKY